LTVASFILYPILFALGTCLVAEGSLFGLLFLFPLTCTGITGGPKKALSAAVLGFAINALIVVSELVLLRQRTIDLPDAALRLGAGLALYAGVGFVIGKLSDSNRRLRQALREVKILQGLIPICAKCKQIRDDKGSWRPFEEYIKEHSEADFSHGLCPACAKELYGDHLSQRK
jgi:hypothetical protein